jgi:hypothetical protein
MGQLVFQATLGGAVNLVGPNTASTFNLNVPAVASTIATLAAQTFAGTQTFSVDAVVNGLTVGRGAGAVATNTAVGASALAANTTSSLNTAFGYNALTLADANNNSAFGYNALSANTSGTPNSAFGRSALASNITGTSNTGIGYGAVQSNTIGGYNVGVGHQSLVNNTTSSYSTAVGFEAGYTQTSGADYNTFIGYRAGKSTTGDQNTFLGKFAGNAVTSGATNTIVGAFNGNQGGLDIRTASNYTVISDGGGTPHLAAYANGTVALQGAVPVAGTGITFPATQSASSNANTLDDYEEGTWTPSIGGNTTYNAQIGRYTKIGRLVTVTSRIYINAIGTGSTNTVSGLPFTVGASGLNNAGSVGFFINLGTSTIFLTANATASATTVTFAGLASSQVNTANAIAVFINSTCIDFTITYEAA